MRPLIGSLCFGFALTACAPLSQHDAVLGDTGATTEQQEQNKAKQQEQYDLWFQSLTPEQRASEIQKQHERALVP